MLLANKNVLNIIDNKIEIYRNHDRPSQHGERTIKNLISSFGLFSGRSDYQLDIGISRLIKSLDSKIKKEVYSLFILKKLKKARYDTSNDGHFGLGFKKYTHFTSPIRRYPDLLVHRLVKASIRGEKKIDVDWNDKALELANKAEINSKNAQNEYIRIKGLRWVFENSKSILDGIFLEFQRKKVIIGLGNSTEIKGEIDINRFPRDQYRTLSDNIGIKGIQKSTLFKIGDRCKVKVEKVDFELMIAHLSFV